MVKAGKLARDEAGVAMGLAVVLIVIVGVMGAGLLVFVRNDLQAVVQTNQGQEAFETSEAGVQAAKRQLLSDATEESYDGQNGDDSPWSYSSNGRELNFDENNVNVSIRHLPFHADDDSCDDDSGDQQNHPYCAPVAKNGENDKRNFFRVVSTGEFDNGDARRKVEAIYNTYDLGVPKAYYSPKTIEINGNACIKDVSVFSLKSIENGGGSGCKSKGGGKGKGGGKDKSSITGTDRAYGDWQNAYNSTARDGNNTDAGFAAPEGVEDKVEGRDYDGSTDRSFVQEPSDPQKPEEITFPFEHKSQEGERDEARIDFFREEARKQERETGDSSHFQSGGSISEWPENSTYSTVVYVDASGASGGKVNWKVKGDCKDKTLKGTLIIDGAGLQVSGKDTFSGVTIIRGGEFKNTGSSCWDGFVNADDGMKLSGTPDPLVSEEVVNFRPGFYGVRQWSWRELYE